jgi:DNA-binding transcriptional MerR regulator
MSKRPYRTSEIAAAVGVHPNTVRLYEAWGFLGTVPRSHSDYRLFSELHLDRMRLARTALQWPYPGGKKPVLELVKCAASGDLGGALEAAHTYLANVRSERVHAEEAVAFLQKWAAGQTIESISEPLQIGQAADRLGVTTDRLRNWDRNGLLDVPRNPSNGYRLYGAAQLGRARVIRLLREAGYSVMAILRMLLELDAGQSGDLRTALDTPPADEDVYNVADRWLSTLDGEEVRAHQIIELLHSMMAKHEKPG